MIDKERAAQIDKIVAEKLQIAERKYMEEASRQYEINEKKRRDQEAAQRDALLKN